MINPGAPSARGLSFLLNAATGAPNYQPAPGGAEQILLPSLSTLVRLYQGSEGMTRLGLAVARRV